MRMGSLKADGRHFLANENRAESENKSETKAPKSNMQSAEKGARDAMQLISHVSRLEFQRNRTTTVLIYQTIHML